MLDLGQGRKEHLNEEKEMLLFFVVFPARSWYFSTHTQREWEKRCGEVNAVLPPHATKKEKKTRRRTREKSTEKKQGKWTENQGEHRQKSSSQLRSCCNIIRFRRSCRECSHHSLEGHVLKERKCGVVGSDKRKEHDFAKTFFWGYVNKNNNRGEENGVFKADKKKKKKRKENILIQRLSAEQTTSPGYDEIKERIGRGRGWRGKKTLTRVPFGQGENVRRFANAFPACLPPGARQHFSLPSLGGAALRGVQRAKRVFFSLGGSKVT